MINVDITYTTIGENMNVRVKYIGKVNFLIGNNTYESGKEYEVSDKVAEHPFFEKLKAEAPKAEEKVESARPKRGTKPKPKAE